MSVRSPVFTSTPFAVRRPDLCSSAFICGSDPPLPFLSPDMRIIAGKARGVPVECPPGHGTRPLLAKVREAMFDIFRVSVPDQTILDLFSGSGAFGIEALSRGAKWIVFVERDPAARQYLEKNLARSRLAEFCDVIQGNVLRCLPRLVRLGLRYRLIFADPPFPLWAQPEARMRLLELADSLADEALLEASPWLVVHHQVGDPAPDGSRHFVLDEQRRYGRSALSIYALREAGNEAKPEETG